MWDGDSECLLGGVSTYLHVSSGRKRATCMGVHRREGIGLTEGKEQAEEEERQKERSE